MNSISGKIIAILEAVSGDSRNNPGTKWMRQDYVLETTDSMYPRKVCFTLWGEDRIRNAAIQMGETVHVEFDIESREYNGRWYTSINGRNITKGEAAPASQIPVAGTLPQTESRFGTQTATGNATETVDDLPF